MRHTYAARECIACGRLLEIGESCNCCQLVRGATRDGLRARCPCFQHRSSFQGSYYLTCCGVKTAHPGSDQRNEHYRRYCCGEYEQCEKFKAMEGENENI